MSSISLPKVARWTGDHWRTVGDCIDDDNRIPNGRIELWVGPLVPAAEVAELRAEVERLEFTCEAHPGKPWPHDDCAGPGMPWTNCESIITRLKRELAEAKAENARIHSGNSFYVTGDEFEQLKSALHLQGCAPSVVFERAPKFITTAETQLAAAKEELERVRPKVIEGDRGPSDQITFLPAGSWAEYCTVENRWRNLVIAKQDGQKVAVSNQLYMQLPTQFPNHRKEVNCDAST